MSVAKSKERRGQVEVSLGFINSGILSLLLVQNLHSSLHKFFQLFHKSPSLPKAEVFQMKKILDLLFTFFFSLGAWVKPQSDVNTIKMSQDLVTWDMSRGKSRQNRFFSVLVLLEVTFDALVYNTDLPCVQYNSC